MEIKYNEVNVITGVYVKSILSQKATGKHLGHYKIRVNDGLEVILLPPYKADAVRPVSEVEKMEGKMVRVTGVVVDRTYMEEPSIENEAQTVNIPCFTEIERIELIED